MYKTRTLKRVCNLVLFAVFAFMLLAANAVNVNAQSAAISSFKVTPNVFNPDVEEVEVDYTVTQPGKVVVTVFDGTAVVENLAVQQDVEAGSHKLTWDGRNYVDQKVSEKSYKVQIYYYSSGFGLFDDDWVTVDYGLDQQDPPDDDDDDDDDDIDDVILNAYAQPNPFDPDKESTYVYFTLTQSANVSVYIEKNGEMINTIMGTQYKASGTHYVAWDGLDSFNEKVSHGTYEYYVHAQGTFGSETAQGYVGVAYDDEVPGPMPQITDDYASPDPFDPGTQNTYIYYTLNTDADVDIEIYKGSSVIRELAKNQSVSSGNNAKMWTGRDGDGEMVPSGVYTYKITAENDSGKESKTGTVLVEHESSEFEDPQITGAFLSPVKFNPSEGEYTTVHYDLNTCAYVGMKVYRTSDNKLVRTILSSEYQCEGSHDKIWNGRNDENKIVADGYYDIKISAINIEGSDLDTKTAEVVDDEEDDDDPVYDVPKLTNALASPEVFDPYDERTKLKFGLNTCADVTIEVRDRYNDLVYEVLDNRELCEGTHHYYWDGRDGNNRYLREDEYEFYIRAENNKGYDVERVDVEIDYDKHIVDENERCGGYLDVSRNDPYCEAIEYVKSRGIFDGYPDGYFRPYQGINRAETTKVVLRGFDYPLLPADGTNLGFWDVIPEAWYMPYLRTAVSYGNIIQGYPDGSFQPARIVNRVELLKIFLKSAKVALPNCTVQPYRDTPIQADTEWYMDYVCYSKMHQLMDTDYYNNFNPAKPITRGDVAMLFYNFKHRNLSVDDNYDYQYNERPKISNLNLSNYTINEGEGLNIYYKLDNSAKVNVKITDNHNYKIVDLLDDKWQSSGSNSVYWNGRNNNGYYVPTGKYTIRIEAKNTYGFSWGEMYFEVK